VHVAKWSVPGRVRSLLVQMMLFRVYVFCSISLPDVRCKTVGVASNRFRVFATAAPLLRASSFNDLDLEVNLRGARLAGRLSFCTDERCALLASQRDRC